LGEDAQTKAQTWPLMLAVAQAHTSCRFLTASIGARRSYLDEASGEFVEPDMDDTINDNITIHLTNRNHGNYDDLKHSPDSSNNSARDC